VSGAGNAWTRRLRRPGSHLCVVRHPSTGADGKPTGDIGISKRARHTAPAADHVRPTDRARHGRAVGGWSGGYLIPNLRPEHFAIYEDGVLQKNATVDIDHAVITMSVLFEGGGRYQELNRMLQTDIRSAAHPLLDALIPADKVAVCEHPENARRRGPAAKADRGALQSAADLRLF
jgi:hypothetical protein